MNEKNGDICTSGAAGPTCTSLEGSELYAQHVVHESSGQSWEIGSLLEKEMNHKEITPVGHP